MPYSIKTWCRIGAIAASPEACSQIVVLSQPLQAICHVCRCHVALLPSHAWALRTHALSHWPRVAVEGYMLADDVHVHIPAGRLLQRGHKLQALVNLSLHSWDGHTEDEVPNWNPQ